MAEGVGRGEEAGLRKGSSREGRSRKGKLRKGGQRGGWMGRDGRAARGGGEGVGRRMIGGFAEDKVGRPNHKTVTPQFWPHDVEVDAKCDLGCEGGKMERVVVRKDRERAQSYRRELRNGPTSRRSSG